MSGRYDSKVNPVGSLDAEKLVVAVFHYVFNIAISASLLLNFKMPWYNWPLKIYPSLLTVFDYCLVIKLISLSLQILDFNRAVNILNFFADVAI